MEPVYARTLRDLSDVVKRATDLGMPLDTPLHFVLHDNDPNTEFWVAVYAGEEGVWEADPDALPGMLAEPNIDNVQWDAHPVGGSERTIDELGTLLDMLPYGAERDQVLAEYDRKIAEAR